MANADSGRISGRRMADVGADGVSRDGNVHAARTSRTPHAVRNVRVEALRLAAIVGISLFHTMMPWTAQALCDPAAGCSRIGDLLGSEPAVLAVLGVIALMGAWGNHVFFMISGFYLIPSLARRSTQAGYWLDALRGTVRRVLVIAQLSYKSTSAASMALAFLLVMVCASGAGGEGVDLARASREAGASGSVAARAVAAGRGDGGFGGVCGGRGRAGWADPPSGAADAAIGAIANRRGGSANVCRISGGGCASRCGSVQFRGYRGA